MRFIRTGLFIALSCLPAFRCEQAIAQVSSVVTLPAWLDEDRALAHTGLGQGYSPYSSYTGQNPDLLTKRDAFRNGSREMLYLGAPSYTRHIKTDWRPPIFNSLLPQGFLENKEDYVSLFESLSPDSRIVGYYWDGGEGLADGGPNSLLQGYSNLGYNWHMPSSWLCKTLAGDFILNGASDGKARGYHADFSNLDYRDFVLERLLELVDRGVYGFYFDERHFPANRESCRHLRMTSTMENTRSIKEKFSQTSSDI